MPISVDLLYAAISFIVTVLILSYLFGDNPLFRAAVYVFVGISAGYVAAVAWNQVIMPQLIRPILSGAVFSNVWQVILLLVPVIGSGLLLTKVSTRLSRLGQLPMAFLVGVGAAVTIGGAVLGTLLPQIEATAGGFDVKTAFARNIDPALMILSSILILIGVVATLAYFHYGARQKPDGTLKRNFVIEILTLIGRIYIAITFGVLFAGVYMAALTALIERMDSLRSFIIHIMQSL